MMRVNSTRWQSRALLFLPSPAMISITLDSYSQSRNTKDAAFLPSAFQLFFSILSSLQSTEKRKHEKNLEFKPLQLQNTSHGSTIRTKSSGFDRHAHRPWSRKGKDQSKNSILSISTFDFPDLESLDHISEHHCCCCWVYIGRLGS